MGTALEFYDFAIYGTAAALVFGEIFFKTDDAWFATFMSLATFALGFVMAPLGAALFGWIGDRFGRRPSLFLAFATMGISTLLMGALPAYAAIGVLAPILLTVLRVFHGLARGGENAGAAVFAIEHAPQKRRGVYGSVVAIGSPIGLILANIAFALVLLLPDQDIREWGWRIPFLMGGVVLVVGLWVRKGVSETPAFQEVSGSPSGELPAVPLWDMLRRRWRIVLLAAGVNVGLTASTYTLATFMLSYGTAAAPNGLGLARQPILLGVLFAMAVHAVANLGSAWVSDRIGRKPVMIAGGVLSLASALTMFTVTIDGTVTSINIAVLIGCTVTGVMFGPLYSFFAELFPRHQRQSGLGFAYHVGGVLGGGISPLVANRIIASTGDARWVGFYLAALLAISVVCILALPETAPAKMSGASADSPGLAGDCSQHGAPTRVD
ncbi:MFS transporter [Mycobacterium kyogaense]|uniref:MFS transporter n=1 Tax=Mycobacterium kyogaense TaxID=2212479 RepID=UPI001F09697F|nr:MFS transporter [Mycobacterium kyogaense]